MATTKPAQQPPALSFPRPIFAAVSPHPFLQAHLSASSSSQKPNAATALRANGRTAHEFRHPGINSGSLTHCNGSAVVRLGNTAVVCGIRAEILKAEDISSDASNPTPASTTSDDDDDEGNDTAELETLRLLVPNIELSTGSTPQHLPGNAPSTYAQTLLTRLRNLLLSSHIVRAKDLRITYTPSTSSEAETGIEPEEEEIKAYWTLYIDTLFISLDGSAFDAAFLAIISALRNLKLPQAYYDEEAETILCSDDPAEARSLNLRGSPVPSTFAVFEAGKGDDGQEGQTWLLSDPDAFEESVCQETVCVVVDCGKGGKTAKSGKGEVVRRIEKSGGGAVGKDVLKGLVKRSVERWEVWDRVLKEQA